MGYLKRRQYRWRKRWNLCFLWQWTDWSPCRYSKVNQTWSGQPRSSKQDPRHRSSRYRIFGTKWVNSSVQSRLQFLYQSDHMLGLLNWIRSQLRYINMHSMCLIVRYLHRNRSNHLYFLCTRLLLESKQWISNLLKMPWQLCYLQRCLCQCLYFM